MHLTYHPPPPPILPIYTQKLLSACEVLLLVSQYLKYGSVFQMPSTKLVGWRVLMQVNAA